VISPLPAEVGGLLREGSFCYLASRSGRWPHLTPVVYGVHASRLWVTTARRSVKASSWKRSPVAAGLVRAGDRALTFAGPVEVHDLLDPSTWVRSVLGGPRVTLAAAEFARRNARFFAGYAVDAPRVPLAWTPPGRVFAAVAMDRAALLGEAAAGRGEPFGRWGSWPKRPAIRSRASFRAGAGARGRHPFDGAPEDVLERIGSDGQGALAVEGTTGLTVLAVRWLVRAGAVYAAVPRRELALAGIPAQAPAALVADHASSWRARAMAGVMARGTAAVHLPSSLRSGRRSAERLLLAAGLDPAHAALVLVRPERVVWWRGWSSGTVRP
jgi:hypothetical protein